MTDRSISIGGGRLINPAQGLDQITALFDEGRGHD